MDRTMDITKMVQFPDTYSYWLWCSPWHQSMCTQSSFTISSWVSQMRFDSQAWFCNMWKETEEFGDFSLHHTGDVNCPQHNTPNHKLVNDIQLNKKTVTKTVPPFWCQKWPAYRTPEDKTTTLSWNIGHHWCNTISHKKKDLQHWHLISGKTDCLQPRTLISHGRPSMQSVCADFFTTWPNTSTVFEGSHRKDRKGVWDIQSGGLSDPQEGKGWVKQHCAL